MSDVAPKTALLIGRTGDGKSFLGNRLLGRDEFESRWQPASLTQSCSIASSEDLQLQVVDTIGLWDTGKTPQDVYNILAEFTDLVPDGVHAIVVVLPEGRCEEEVLKTLVTIEIFFGENVWAHSIVVYNQEARTAQQIWEDRDVEALAQFMDKWKGQGADLCTVRYSHGDDSNPQRAKFDSQVLEVKRSILRRERVYTVAMFRQARQDVEAMVAQTMQSMGPGVVGMIMEWCNRWTSSWPAEMEKLNKQLEGCEISTQEYNDRSAPIQLNHARLCSQRTALAMFLVGGAGGGAGGWVLRLASFRSYGLIATGAVVSAVTPLGIQKIKEVARPSAKKGSS